MSKENKFLVFVVEYYRNKKNMIGKEVIALFDKFNIWDFAKSSYVFWHIESPEHFVTEIDEFILEHGAIALPSITPHNAPQANP